jgi:hypothetical protein
MSANPHIWDGTEWLELAAIRNGDITVSNERVPVCFGALASAPTAQGVGDTYYNTTSSFWFAWNGTTWDQLN